MNLCFIYNHVMVTSLERGEVWNNFYFSSNTTNVATGSFCEYGMSVRLVKDL
jgi:hypothetical protein